MCSINGIINFEPQQNKFTENQLYEIQKRLNELIINGEKRGRDSFGYTIFNKFTMVDLQNMYEDNGDLWSVKTVKYANHKPSDILIKHPIIFNNDVKLIMNNNRAEPTTEYVKGKKSEDVQPFTNGQRITIVHNGTIANDNELRQKYNIQTNTTIDSSVIPFLFENVDFNNLNELKRILTEELIGSYALAVYDEPQDKLILANNYKPLYIAYDTDLNILFFTSIENYLGDNSIFSTLKIQEIKPYTCMVIDIKTRDIKTISLYDEPNKKALICASAGMDSTVAATWAIENGYDIELLHFKYQCRAEDKETFAIQNIAQYFKCPLTFIDADFFANKVGGSRLYNSTETVADGISGAELALEWVPARNLVFMSIAAAYAESKGIHNIILGGNLEESGAYADNELIFQTKFNDLLPNALNLGHQVRVLTPIANLMKHEIVKMGIELNAPLHLTWSCYNNNEHHCGECGPCYMRKTAFKMNKINEVIKYIND